MNHKQTVLTISLLFLLSMVCFAQNPTVDNTFAPALSKLERSSAIIYKQTIQPDGKLIVSGNFQVVNGTIKPNVARFNTNGSLDTTFNCSACTFVANNAVVQPDGKIVISGSYNIIRVNSDGSLDNSFNYVQTSAYSVEVRAVQPDGKILFRVISTGGGGHVSIYRLNTDGSRDTGFSTAIGAIFLNQTIDVKVLSDGRVFVHGDNSFGYLAQINSDGSKNTAFESPALTHTIQSPYITDLSLQSDGKILIIGKFSTVNGINRTNVARLNANQSLDTSFNTTFSFIVNFSGYVNGRIFALSNNKILIGTDFLSTAQGKIQRLNNDGSVDNTFTPPTNITTFYSMLIDSSERIYAIINISSGTPVITKLIRYNANGTPDTSYNATVEETGAVQALALQPDGKILVGGDVDKVNGIDRKTVLRLNPNGTPDLSFDTGQKIDGTINDFAIQTDGKIIVVGRFTYNGVAKKFIRLNFDGSLDTGFNTSNADDGAGNGLSTALQSDGKILIGGIFTSVNGTAKSGFARLNSDGSLDTSFDVQLGGTQSVYDILVQSDGKIFIVGSFNGVNGFNRVGAARLNSDGTLDSSFNASVGSRTAVLIQPDGKYLVLGSSSILRLNSSGSTDTTFTSPSLSVSSSFALLDDNSIVVSGTFTTVGGVQRNKLVRLKQNGSVDSSSFTLGADSDPQVFLKLTGNRLLAGGAFTTIEGINRTGLAQLSFNSFNKAQFDFDGDGRTDIVAYRPSNSVWHQLLGSNYQYSSVGFGIAEDKIVPADYDGDGKTDIAIFRPSTGAWWYASSAQNGAYRAVAWGQSGDIPLPSDFNGDGKADFVLYRPSNNTWYRLTDSGISSIFAFGTTGDKPVIGDFDGDGKADPAIFRPSTGAWWYASSAQSNSFRAVQFGAAEDISVTGDYDGDGKTDVAVFRPSNGGWYILNSGNNSVTSVQFGTSGDKPVAGDYDGDGKADIAVFRPSNGSWYILRSTAGFAGLQFGASTDVPIPNAFTNQ